MSLSARFAMHDVVSCIIMAMQFVLLAWVTHLVSLVRSKLHDAADQETPVAKRCKHWVVHVVRDTDVARTPCVVITESGHLVEMNTDVHAALLDASQSHDTDALLAGDTLHDVEDADGPVLQMQFTRTAHHGICRETMHRVLEEYKCDLVPVHEDAPPPFLILHNAHAVLGVLLAREHAIPSSPEPCDNRHPNPQSPRKTVRRRGAVSACVTTPTT